VRDYDPPMALNGGRDGLDFYRRLAVEGHAWLKPSAALMAEFGDGQGQAICELFTSAGWTIGTLSKDYSGRDRILIARSAD